MIIIEYKTISNQTIPYPFSTKEEYEKIINSEAYKKFTKFCIGIESIDIPHFFYNFLNPLFSDQLEYLEKITFNSLFQNLEMFNYIIRGKIFKKKKIVESRKKKSLKNYIKYCKNFTFKNNYENSVTYFITDGEYVKIGQSIKPKERLLTFQPCNPKKLTLLAILKNISESEAHFLFSNKHVNREWYKFDTEVMLKIESLKRIDTTQKYLKLSKQRLAQDINEIDKKTIFNMIK